MTPCASLIPAAKRQQDIRPVTKPTWKNCGKSVPSPDYKNKNRNACLGSSLQVMPGHVCLAYKPLQQREAPDVLFQVAVNKNVPTT